MLRLRTPQIHILPLNPTGVAPGPYLGKPQDPNSRPPVATTRFFLSFFLMKKLHPWNILFIKYYIEIHIGSPRNVIMVLSYAKH